jgi:hypothetical protein
MTAVGVAATAGAATSGAATEQLRFDRRELSGALADLGVLVPIAVALIVNNGLSATAVLLPAGLLYVAVARIYRLPVPVQPLKAFGAIAIARGIGPDGIAAGALLTGLIFLFLGSTGLLDVLARGFPKAVVRGVLLFLQIAGGLVSAPQASFADASLGPGYLVAGTAVVAVSALLLRRRPITLVLVALGIAAMVARHQGAVPLGPTPLAIPHLDLDTLAMAFVVLVVPQLPLTFANACLATADAAHAYFGERAERVQPGRLAVSLGTANLLAGAIGGMPVCHGAGGLTAHVTFGARTGGAPLALGAALVLAALVFGAGLAGLLTGFPLPILAGLLVVAGLLHIALLRDLQGLPSWALALGVGVLGYAGNLALALALGLALYWGARGLDALRSTLRRADASLGR